jgi:hypothetical protein
MSRSLLLSDLSGKSIKIVEPAGGTSSTDTSTEIIASYGGLTTSHELIEPDQSSGILFSHPEILLIEEKILNEYDTIPFTNEQGIAIINYICYSICFTHRFPQTRSKMEGTIYPNLRTSDVTNGLFNAIGHRCLDGCFQPLSRDPKSSSQLPIFGLWTPPSEEDLIFVEKLRRFLDDTFCKMRKYCKITFGELKQMIILLERVLSSPCNTTDFTLDEGSLPMCVVSLLALVVKVLSADTEMSYAHLAKKFGFPSDYLVKSELFLLTKLGFLVRVTNEEWERVNILMEGVMKVFGPKRE